MIFKRIREDFLPSRFGAYLRYYALGMKFWLAPATLAIPTAIIAILLAMNTDILGNIPEHPFCNASETIMSGICILSGSLMFVDRIFANHSATDMMIPASVFEKFISRYLIMAIVPLTYALAIFAFINHYSHRFNLLHITFGLMLGQNIAILLGSVIRKYSGLITTAILLIAGNALLKNTTFYENYVEQTWPQFGLSLCCISWAYQIFKKFGAQSRWNTNKSN